MVPAGVREEDLPSRRAILRVRNNRLNAICKNVLVRAGRGSVLDLLKKYFNRKESEKGLQKILGESAIAETPKKEVSSPLNAPQRSESEKSPRESALERRTRLMSYGRWYLRPAEFANGLRLAREKARKRQQKKDSSLAYSSVVAL